MTIKIEDVFGVSGKQVASYVERVKVDDEFKDALRTDKQIIVYGASKQGKSALVQKYIPYDENIVISLSPKTTLKDIYHSILRKSNITLRVSFSEGTGNAAKIKGKASVQGAIALVLKGKVSLEAESSDNYKEENKYEEIEFNLELPDDVADLIHKVGSKKVIVLENFHYLPEEVQRTFAYDLRSFQELKVRFIILGVWKEANRLSQFNGELQDRILEIPVEPWDRVDFERIASKGSNLLGISFSSVILDYCIDNSFQSVGVFQELLKVTCQESDIHIKQAENIFLSDIEAYKRAILKKTEEYSGRHLKNLDAIASANSSSIVKDAPLPYFMNYYIVMHILKLGYSGINAGIGKESLLLAIKEVHHRKEELKNSQLTSALKALTELQCTKAINPPVLAYDSNSMQLKVVDSTFNFFLKNADLKAIENEIICPWENLA